FRSSIALLPAIQATGRLVVAPGGLTPAERASLCWTHENASFVFHTLGNSGLRVTRLARASVTKLLLSTVPLPSPAAGSLAAAERAAVAVGTFGAGVRCIVLVRCDEIIWCMVMRSSGGSS